MNETERFEELYQRTRPKVRQYITSFLLFNHKTTNISPEDLLQCIYAVAWEKREKLYTLENQTGWLIECAKRIYKALLREEKKWSANVELVDDMMSSRRYSATGGVENDVGRRRFSFA